MAFFRKAGLTRAGFKALKSFAADAYDTARSKVKSAFSSKATSEPKTSTRVRKDPSLKTFRADPRANAKNTAITRSLDNQALSVLRGFKSDLISNVRNHGICQELINKDKPSAFLHGASGSLFGFLGFEAGDDPVGDLVDYLEKNIYLTGLSEIKNRQGALIMFGFGVNIPSEKDMRSEKTLRLPWESGQSWPYGIENGISGLPYFMNKMSKESRSKEGFQASKPVRIERFTPVDFLSPMLAEFRRKVNDL